MISKIVLLVPCLVATLSHAADHLVTVGKGGLLKYDPETVIAEIGDTVTFDFFPKNHTVTQSSFAAPCTPLEGGQKSGFLPVADGETSDVVFQITVATPDVFWIYCGQKNPKPHCEGTGMVFAINPPTEGNTFEKFKAAAIALPAGAAPSSSASAPPASSSTTSSAAPSPTSSSTWTSPPAPVVSTLTTTVSWHNSVYTTTYASWENTAPNPTPAAQPATHTVVVGGSAGLVFTPPTVDALVGDIVEFQFQVKNHSVVQSVFNKPCSPSPGGFNSGFKPVAANVTTFPTFQYTVNVTTPVWGYCAQTVGTHCTTGMVFGINAPKTGSNTFLAFQQLAQHTTPTSATNSTPASGGSGAGAGSGSSGNGAGRAAASAALGVGAVGVLFAALL